MKNLTQKEIEALAIEFIQTFFQNINSTILDQSTYVQENRQEVVGDILEGNTEREFLYSFEIEVLAKHPGITPSHVLFGVLFRQWIKDKNQHDRLKAEYEKEKRKQNISVISKEANTLQ